METPFQIKLTDKRLTAEIHLVRPLNDAAYSLHELEGLLLKQGVTYGIHTDILNQIASNPSSVSFPVIIATGIPPENGTDAILQNELHQENQVEKKKFNFRDVLTIPSVQNGQLIARVIHATPGTPGQDVCGKPIPAKNGSPLRVRAGKNVVFTNDCFYATMDGQVSFMSKSISVNPIFEVRGDLDLRTGNIDFIGNVTINGNVPTGFRIKAGGDIRIFGLVEGAHLEAQGNILISGGITGANRGFVQAGGTIQAAFMNQASVHAGQEVHVSSSILHSKVQAGESIVCKQGVVIGGALMAGKDIHVKELGNHLFTKSEIYAGWDPMIEEVEKSLNQQLNEKKANIEKLTEIENKLLHLLKATGNLSAEQKDLLLKQRSTKEQFTKELAGILENLEDLQEKRLEQLLAKIYVYETVHPNTYIHFGKYTKHIQQKHAYAKFYFKNGEILFETIN
ncbi:FapA family protein [Cytobacillus spongiae]|uniref:DUF342 domain-containing protein n=1 Tax=Cytobacillus spongiae TaxID=2901381 RepID=UPI001F397F6C|nr:FapA family protein [Cytobacillus spongiae]UII57436.1 FapA family protein [Cytobacillus spongiae]